MKRLSPDAYISGVLASDRVVLSRAITLVESSLPSDALLAQQVMDGLAPHQPAHAMRIGITGVPGVGKSTFIEAFGLHIVELGKRVAILAIDPSSQRTKGSIMGDKTRMDRLAVHPMAYIRPSASGTTLGGVARKTREAIFLCEAAGFDMVLVETVGVGQSEVAVKEMTDFFLLLMLAGAGDELQGIKKGIMEMADALAITKADGGNEKAAMQAKAAYKSALHLFPLPQSGWNPQVLTCSAMTGQGMEAVWLAIDGFFKQQWGNGWLMHNRSQQQIHWLSQAIQEGLLQGFYQNPHVQAQWKEATEAVAQGKASAYSTAQRLLQLAK